jgi:hypothetical protein
MAEAIDPVHLWLIALVLFTAMIGARELGGWVHRKVAGMRDGTAEDGIDKGFILTGMLGLLALLTAFTFSLALDRFEERRTMVVTEANAIGTAEMRVRLLPAPYDAQMAGVLQDYARTRLAYGRANSDGKRALMPKAAAQRTAIQAATIAAIGPEGRNALGLLVTPAINDVLDLGAAREALNASRLPSTILVALVAYNLLTAAMMGYALTGARARQRPATVVLFVLFALAIVLILDLDRPQRGTIRVDQTPMQQLVDGFAPLPEAPSEPQASLR